MKKLISLAALAVCLGVPVNALADDTPATTAPILTPGQRFDIVDRQTGRVIGELVAVGPNRAPTGNVGSVRLQVPPPADTQTKWAPRKQESAAFWEEFNRLTTGPSAP